MKLRTERGYSREEFAALVHVCPKHLYEVEMGLAEPGYLVIGSICETLGCDWNTLNEGITGARGECERRHAELARRRGNSAGKPGHLARR